jgi:hypothetical protein
MLPLHCISKRSVHIYLTKLDLRHVISYKLISPGSTLPLLNAGVESLFTSLNVLLPKTNLLRRCPYTNIILRAFTRPIATLWKRLSLRHKPKMHGLTSNHLAHQPTVPPLKTLRPRIEAEEDKIDSSRIKHTRSRVRVCTMPRRCSVCKIECERPLQCSKCHGTM